MNLTAALHHIIAENTLIAYHGTPRKKFGKLKLDQKPTSERLFGNALYFTDSESTAESFAVGKWGTVFTVDLGALKFWDANSDDSVTKKIAKSLKIRNIANHLDEYKKLYKSLDKSLTANKRHDILIKAIKQAGFDGIKVQYQKSLKIPGGRVIGGEDWYMVYQNENKIKYIEKRTKNQDTTATTSILKWSGSYDSDDFDDALEHINLMRSRRMDDSLGYVEHVSSGVMILPSKILNPKGFKGKKSGWLKGKEPKDIIDIMNKTYDREFDHMLNRELDDVIVIDGELGDGFGRCLLAHALGEEVSMSEFEKDES